MSKRFRAKEIEVPGSPEEVWRTIATGPGHATWLFPADIEPVEGGAMVIHRRPYGDDAQVTVTTWDPPHRFGFAEPIGLDAPALTTEFLVATKRGGGCVVRVVSGLSDDGEGWEDLLDGASEGWRMGLVVLRAYLTHFAGLSSSNFDVLADTGLPHTDRAQAFAGTAAFLGLTELTEGASFRMAELAGTVEHVSEGYALLRVTRPYSALFAISCFPMGQGAALTVNLLARLYGAPDGVAERERVRWQTRLAEVRASFH
ncbi:MAG TPA: SRPBCC domain-containing protein [Pseudonocardiaceae bacterium]|jgi:uncharacterized protein YndB with AHSA1/START domain|nr:SRPBCC domain-containing protein [Pseudonocardiaceae bacterium]